MIVAPQRILPVVVIDRVSDAVPLAEALLAGGITVAEVTLRTSAALEAIEAMRGVDGFAVGAGTVRSPGQAEEVQDAGAAFAVAPGLDPAVVARCAELGLPLIPGVATASELQQGLDAGLTRLKLFPAANLGGPSFVRALASVFPEARFYPSGGISADVAGDYLAIDSVEAVCGSWMVPAALLERRDWTGVTRLAREAVEGVRA